MTNQRSQSLHNQILLDSLHTSHNKYCCGYGSSWALRRYSAATASTVVPAKEVAENPQKVLLSCGTHNDPVSYET